MRFFQTMRANALFLTYPKNVEYFQSQSVNFILVFFYKKKDKIH